MLTSEIINMATSFEIYYELDYKGSPITLGIGFEYEERVIDFEERGYREVIGWIPKDEIGVSAGCNGEKDHRALAEVCVLILRHIGGLIDFGSSLTPPIQGDLRKIYQEDKYRINWEKWEPYSVK